MPIVPSTRARCRVRSGASCGPSPHVAPLRSAATSRPATRAGISASPTTAAGTGTARSASPSLGRSGSRIANPSCLDCPYFHVVFTLPEEIAAIAYQNKAIVYNLLFAATAETLCTIAADPKHLGAEIGFFAVLHTWGQNLMHHPHLHCVVPGGGLSADGQRWIACRSGFFLPVRVLSRFFRRRFLELLGQAFGRGELEFFSTLEPLREQKAFRRYLDPLREKEWVVYAKAPFAGPEQVLDYVGRYTHRVAISNNRLLDIEDGHVTFRWKRLSRWRRSQDHDPHGRGVHPPLPTARPAVRLSPHPLLRAPRQSSSAEEARAVPPPPGHEPRDAEGDRGGRADRLPRPLRGTHRRIPARMSRLSARPHGPHRAAPTLEGSGNRHPLSTHHDPPSPATTSSSQIGSHDSERSLLPLLPPYMPGHSSRQLPGITHGF